MRFLRDLDGRSSGRIKSLCSVVHVRVEVSGLGRSSCGGAERMVALPLHAV